MGLQYQAVFLLLALCVKAIYDCPFPFCKDECLPASVHDAPGIGFGLSFSSAQVSSHLYNTTVLDVAHVSVPTDSDYALLMARLASSHKPPPLSSWEKWRRSINKRLGRPATRDVGILSGVLAVLRENAERTVPGHELDRVVVTHSTVPGLASYDLVDALEHVGLRPWLTATPADAGLYPTKVTEAHAVFAAMGLGLCRDYKNLFECWEEEEGMERRVVLLAGFTKADLRAELREIRAPFEWDQDLGYVDGFVDLDAGLHGMENFESGEAFWGHVRYRLKALVNANFGVSGKLSRVLLVGENATHPRFLAALRDSLGQVEVQTEERADPVFAAARGAAQYARWRQEAPIGCRERKECEEKRDKERQQMKEEVDGVFGSGDGERVHERELK